MLLNPMDDVRVVQRIVAIAELGDPRVAYLLLVTPWTGYYVQALFPGVQTPLRCKQQRVHLASRFLSERDGDAWSALEKIERTIHAVSMPVRQVLDYANLELGVVFGPVSIAPGFLNSGR